MVSTEYNSIVRPLTTTEAEELKKNLQPMFNDYSKKITALKEKHRLEIERAEKLEQVAKLKMEAGQQKIDSGQQKIASAQQKFASAQQKFASAQQKSDSAEKKSAQADQKRQEADKRQIVILSTIFYRIFYGPKSNIPKDKLKEIIKEISPLAKESIIFNQTGKCFDLISMKSVIAYLEAHKDIDKCDFGYFKGNIPDTLKTQINNVSNSRVKPLQINY